jgi:uncharacterized membrane protein YfcA
LKHGFSRHGDILRRGFGVFLLAVAVHMIFGRRGR